MSQMGNALINPSEGDWKKGVMKWLLTSLGTGLLIVSIFEILYAKNLPSSSIIILLSALIYIGCGLFSHKIKRTEETIEFLTLFAVSIISLKVITGGGINSGLPFWYIFPILMANYFSSKRFFYSVTIVCVMSSLAILLLFKTYPSFSFIRNETFNQYNVILQMLGIFVCLAVFSLAFVKLRKDYFALLSKSQEDLIRATELASLGEITGKIAHEISNPLTVIKGKARLLRIKFNKEGLGSTETFRSIEKIENTSNRISKILKGLRSFSYSNSQVKKYSSSSVHEVLDRVVEFTNRNYEQSKVQIITHRDINDSRFQGDQNLITQIVAHCLFDCIEGVISEDAPVVTLDYSQSEETIHIDVYRNNSNEEQKLSKKFFRPFFLSGPPIKEEGIVLKISKKILSQHKGELTLENIEGVTYYKISLPKEHSAKSSFKILQENSNS